MAPPSIRKIPADDRRALALLASWRNGSPGTPLWALGFRADLIEALLAACAARFVECWCRRGTLSVDRLPYDSSDHSSAMAEMSEWRVAAVFGPLKQTPHLPARDGLEPSIHLWCPDANRHAGALGDREGRGVSPRAPSGELPRQWQAR